MQHHHVAAPVGRGMDAHFDVLGAAAARHHLRMQAVGEVQDLLLAL
jgi:hypothetical protein